MKAPVFVCQPPLTVMVPASFVERSLKLEELHWVEQLVVEMILQGEHYLNNKTK